MCCEECAMLDILTADAESECTGGDTAVVETELCPTGGCVGNTADCGGENVSLHRASKINLGTRPLGDVADWEVIL